MCSVRGNGSSTHRKRSCPTLTTFFWWYKIYILCPILSWLQVYFALRWMLLTLKRKHQHLQTPHHHMVSYCSFTTWMLSGVCDKAEANSHSFCRNDKKLFLEIKRRGTFISPVRVWYSSWSTWICCLLMQRAKHTHIYKADKRSLSNKICVLLYRQTIVPYIQRSKHMSYSHNKRTTICNFLVCYSSAVSCHSPVFF